MSHANKIAYAIKELSKVLAEAIKDERPLSISESFVLSYLDSVQIEDEVTVATFEQLGIGQEEV